MSTSSSQLIPRELYEWVERVTEAGVMLPEIREAHLYLEEHYDELREQFPSEWVAVAYGQVQAHAKDPTHVYMELKRRGVSWDVAAVRYFRRPGELAEMLLCS